MTEQPPPPRPPPYGGQPQQPTQYPPPYPQQSNYGYGYPIQPPASPTRSSQLWWQRGWVLAAAGVVILLIGIGIGAAANGGSSKKSAAADHSTVPSTAAAPSFSAPSSSPPATTSAPPAPPKPAGPPHLKKSDFKIGIRIRTKECFGSAGCDLTYQINPSYLGAADLSGHSWDITYEVLGLEDGPQIDTFTISGNRAHFDKEEVGETDSTSYTLRAKVTGIENDS